MEKENCVSIWVGDFSSALTLDTYVQPHYSPDGEYLGSAFSRDFRIAFIDENFREADTFEPTTELSVALSGFSYDEKIIAEISTTSAHIATEINSAILIYNLKYTGHIKEIQLPDGNIFFLGTATYR